MDKHAREYFAKICRKNGDVKSARRYEEGLYNSLGTIDTDVLDNLIEEVLRLRENNETLRKMDWEYECLWTWLAENTNLLNTIEPLMEEWNKEYDEE